MFAALLVFVGACLIMLLLNVSLVWWVLLIY